jgi:hypothetical protein
VRGQQGSGCSGGLGRDGVAARGTTRGRGHAQRQQEREELKSGFEGMPQLVVGAPGLIRAARSHQTRTDQIVSVNPMVAVTAVCRCASQ